jgi:Na+-translocating ferredoxin:NAD+ oxidoreductase RNF subunit RnfB
MGGVGLILAAILAVADKKLAVEEDPLVEKAVEILPGANCGACGYAGCLAFATALAEGKAPIAGCKPGGAEVAEALAELHGLEAESVSPNVARVFCSGGVDETVRDKVYTGIKTCLSANIVGGEKACLYSCIGFGDCCEVCAFDAIHMDDNGLPVVDLGKCTGCGECVKVCPRNIIGLTDHDEVVHVYCRSRDKGPVAKKICTAGCIACKICEKDDGTGAVKVTDFLAVIDHEVNKAPVTSVNRCPTKVIRVSDPMPGYEKHFKEKIKEAQLTDEKTISKE